MTTVYFVRHAAPNYENPDDRTRELTAAGVESLPKLLRFFQDIHLDAVLSSSYRRAVQTVAPLAQARGLEIRLVEDFRERKIADNWVADFESYSRHQWQDFDFALPTGESLHQTQQRNMAALLPLLREYKDKTIAIGCHGTSLSTIFHYYDPSFGYDGFDSFRRKMPWIARFIFEGERCLGVETFDLENCTYDIP